MKKALWLSLAATSLWTVSEVWAQPIPIPEIRPPGTSEQASVQEPTTEEQSLRQRWSLVAQKLRDMEASADYAPAFLASKELRTCKCEKPDAWAILRALDEGRHMEGGTTAELRCGFCILEKHTQWQERVFRQCALMLTLSPFELERLEKSEDADGLPKHCFARARRMDKPAVAAVQGPQPPPKLHNLLEARKEGHRYVRVVAGPICVVSLEGSGLQFGSKDWLEVPPNVTQLRLKSSCQATAEIYFGTKATFEHVEQLPAGESRLLHLGKR